MRSSRFVRLALAVALVALLALAAGASAQSGPLGGGPSAQGAPEKRAGHEAGTDEIPRGDDDYVVSFKAGGSVSNVCFGPGNYSRGDAMYLENHGPDAPCWIKWFDATNSGLDADANINALHDECGPGDPGCFILVGFQARTRLPGVGYIRPQDFAIAQYSGPAFDQYGFWDIAFDGSDVGLTQAGEKIDALYRFDPGEGPDDLNCLELLLISTSGAYSVPGAWGNPLTGGGEDVLGFCADSVFEDTSGYWFLYHDGGAEGAPANSIVGLSHEDGQLAYARFEFLTKGSFWADSANGGLSDVFYFFDGAYNGPTYNFMNAAWATDHADSFTVYHSD
jgi:hypothetical protein